MNKSNKVGVYWDDIFVYYDTKKHALSLAYTEGELVKETEDYILIKNPETVLTSDEGTRNHPLEKPMYYYIPKALIKNMSRYE